MYPAPRNGGFIFSIMSTLKKIIVLIDGGHLRALANRAKKKYVPDFIEKFAHSCKSADEDLFRILYYDCAPYVGVQKLPVSGTDHQFQGSDKWLHDLSHKDLFAVRKGVLKFRGFKPRKPLSHLPPSSLMLISSHSLNRRVSTCESVSI